MSWVRIPFVLKFLYMTFFITISCTQKQLLFLYKIFVTKLLKKLKIDYKIKYKPLHKKRITILKSPHIHKKAQEHFEINYNAFCIKFNTNINILNYLYLNKPAGLYLKILIKK